MLAAAGDVVTACGRSGSTSGRPSSSVSPTLTLGQEYPAMKAAARAATSVAVYGAVLVKGRRENLDKIFTKSRALTGLGSQARRTVPPPPPRPHPHSPD